jgi:hypothetical protein
VAQLTQLETDQILKPGKHQPARVYDRSFKKSETRQRRRLGKAEMAAKKRFQNS